MAEIVPFLPAILTGVGVAAEGGKAIEQFKAEQANLEGLSIQNKQNQIQTQQKTIQNYSNLEKILDAQTATESVRGVSLSSPSFNAIQRNTFNTAMKEQANINENQNVENQNYDVEKKMVHQSLFGDFFQDVAETAGSVANFYTSKPSK